MKLTKVFSTFFESEKSGGIVLVLVTVLSLIIANSNFGGSYIDFWHFDIGGHSLAHWINDGLMTIFFLLIGLELEREIYDGELSKIRNASLPLFGALGGMLVPALIYLSMNFGTETQDGAGIPMATDIAFAVGVLSLLGKRVPASLKIFLTALAVIDDLGAIMVIAVFYSQSISLMWLAGALIVWGVLFIFNRMKVHNLIPYLLGGVVMWYCMLNSGVHATIAGVILAFVIPFGDGGKKTASYVLQHFLHKPVAFFILPVFAMANTAIIISSDWHQGLTSMSSVGIITGLLIGKPLGIWLFSFAASKAGLCRLPPGLNWNNIVGAGMLGGIGFTMSIFITLLAFDDTSVIEMSKIAILVASLFAGVMGYLTLNLTLRKKRTVS